MEYMLVNLNGKVMKQSKKMSAMSSAQNYRPRQAAERYISRIAQGIQL
jgi:hypothetical protein